MPEAWAPGLADVARHVPRRTRDVKSPGSDRLLMTFSAATTPDGDAVQQFIDDAVGSLLARTGPLPATAAQYQDVADLARTAVEWRVAADIELAYPVRDADVQVYAQLNQRANDAFTALQAAITEAEGPGYEAGSAPAGNFPPPPPWGDSSPGSGAPPAVPVWPFNNGSWS